MAKTAICLWCGEDITNIGGTWRHDDPEDRELAHIFCDCHCAKCDPEGGYTDGRTCVDGEAATPDLLTIREEVPHG